jgi:hypothetical protein
MQAIKYSQTAIKSLHKDLKIHRTPYEKINSREKKKKHQLSQKYYIQKCHI